MFIPLDKLTKHDEVSRSSVMQFYSVSFVDSSLSFGQPPAPML